MLLGDLIEMQFLGSAYNPHFQVQAIALVMMIIVTIFMYMINKFGDGEEQAVMLSKKKSSVGGKIFMALVFIFLYAPIFVLIVFSFNKAKSRTQWTGFTFDWYKELFSDSAIMNSLYVTLAVSVIAALVATVVGTITAVGLSRIEQALALPHTDNKQYSYNERRDCNRRIPVPALCVTRLVFKVQSRFRHAPYCAHYVRHTVRNTVCHAEDTPDGQQPCTMRRRTFGCTSVSGVQKGNDTGDYAGDSERHDDRLYNVD